MRWLALSVETGNEAVEAVSEILCRLGRGAAVRPTRLLTDPGDELAAREDPAAPYVVTAHVPAGPGASAEIERTQRALWHLRAFDLAHVSELRVEAVEDRDWATAWRAHYTPQRIGRLVIVPSWLDEPLHDGETAIRLDPGMAFGTGLHPSTRGCLELLQRVSPMPAELLDVGSGSGILAIAGLRLGARRATCLDIDPLAIEATTRNAELNGLGAAVVAHRGELPDPPLGAFPLVCANLVASVLIASNELLVAHLAPRAILLAGGIIGERLPEVEGAFSSLGLRAVDRIALGDWVTLRLDAPGASVEVG